MDDSTLPQAVTDAFADREFEAGGPDAFVETSTAFDGRVRIESADSTATYRIAVSVPTLGAVVVGDEPASVVEEGWLDTLERRLADAPSVARTEIDAAPAVTRDQESVVFELAFDAAEPDRAAADVLAIVQFVEGTWVQGAIPGYEYGEPARSLLGRAREMGRGTDEPR